MGLSEENISGYPVYTMFAINDLSSQLESKHWISRHFAFACFPAHLAGCMVSRAFHQLQVFLSSSLEAYFPALAIGEWWHVFTRFLPVTCFPVLASIVHGLALSSDWPMKCFSPCRLAALGANVSITSNHIFSFVFRQKQR